MSVDKNILLQKQVRNNSEDLRAYLHDLALWEKEMKRKESELNDEVEESELRKKSQKTSSKKPKRRISGFDYAAWEKFDAEEHCEKIDKDKESGSSGAEEDALEEHNRRLREESLVEKERGNAFVRQKQWSAAIPCYTHAIACYSQDPIYYANRALCFLKLNDWRSAEADATAALQLSPNYVKALQRRAAARAALRQVKEAVTDLERVLLLEPHNLESRAELEKLQARPPTTTNNNEPSAHASSTATVSCATPHVHSAVQWPDRKSATPVAAVQKPPHQRSRKPLRRLEVRDSAGGFDSTGLLTNIDYSSGDPLATTLAQALVDETSGGVLNDTGGQASTAVAAGAPHQPLAFPIPKSSVQFYASWKAMRHRPEQKFLYLSRIEPTELPNIFRQYLESDVLSDIINVLEEWFVAEDVDVYPYLLALSNTGRFSALVMFLSNKDKSALNNLFDYCVKKNVSSEKMDALRQAYEM